MSSDEAIRFWRDFIGDPFAPWVLFRHGTCVILDEPAWEPADRATELLLQHGPVIVGTDSADFNVIDAGDGRGRIVTCRHQAILTYVAPDDAPPGADEMVIGLIGRARRHADATQPVVHHIEQVPRGRPACGCLHAPGEQLSVRRELGMDSAYAEATVLACRACGRHWLRYFYEHEAFTGSGRWYMGHIPTSRSLALAAGEAKRVLERLEWYHVGGSYFGGRVSQGRGKITVTSDE